MINDSSNFNDLELKKRKVFLTALPGNGFRKISECPILSVLT